MNLALLDPFRRQVPDRIDSTLALPRTFHPPRPPSSSTLLPGSSSSSIVLPAPSSITESVPRKRRAASVASRSTSSQLASSSYSKSKSRKGKSKSSSSTAAAAEEDAGGTNPTEGETNEWHSCFAVSFNPRGNYIGAGHGSGIVPIHDFASRTLSSIFAPPHSALKKHLDEMKKKKKKKRHDKKGKNKRKRIMVMGGGEDSDDEGGGRDKEHLDDGYGDDYENEGEEENEKSGSDDDDDGNSSSESEKKDYFYIPDPSLTAGLDQKTRKRKQQVLQKLEEEKKQQERLFQNGITSISWSRDSRTMLIASYKDSHVCLVNHEHPYGPEDAYFGLKTGSGVGGNGNSTRDTETSANGSTSSSPIPDSNVVNDKGSTTGVSIRAHGQEEDINLDEEIGDAGEIDTGDEHNEKTTNKAILNNIDNLKRFVFKDALYVSNVNQLKPNQDIDMGVDDTNDRTVSNETRKLVELTAEELSILTKPPPYTYEEDFILQRLSMRLECKECTIEQAYQATKKKIAQTTHYQTLLMGLPQPLGVCAQIHPIGYGGLACLENGSLVLFRMPYGGFKDHLYADPSLTGEMNSRKMRISGDHVYLSRPPQGKDDSEDGTEKQHELVEEEDEEDELSYHIICAAFDTHGNKVYAATKCGKLILYHLDPQFERAIFPRDSPSPSTDPDNKDPSQFFCRKFSKVLVVKISSSGGSTVAPNQIVLSRNGQMVLLNCKDGVLRLYDSSALWRERANDFKGTKEELYVKPKHTFQDVVSKSKWASCDFSGDGEYIVGGCNNYESGDKYELYFWNTANGTLIDQLLGPQIHLYSLSWHPTRSFIAVGTSDGMVDIWGPRLDWTNFAPDFQSLQKNVEYVEKEDEFDTIVDVDHDEEAAKRNRIEEEAIVDITTMDDDSENEDETFYFDAKMRDEKTRV